MGVSGDFGFDCWASLMNLRLKKLEFFELLLSFDVISVHLKKILSIKAVSSNRQCFLGASVCF